MTRLQHPDATHPAAYVVLPSADGGTSRYGLRAGAPLPRVHAPSTSRSVFAAAHVVTGPCHDGGAVDLPATLAVRDRLWDLGLGVAEAMDTAQRGQGLAPDLVANLVRASADRAAERRRAGLPAELAVGVAGDALAPAGATPVAVAAAYRDELESLAGLDVTPVLMCHRGLARSAAGAEDYVAVYGEVLRGAERPVVLHWLGEAFDPQLQGYWVGGDDVAPDDVVARIIAENADRVAGIKVSILDAARERALRARVPEGVRVYTGDDFHYVDLIAGDDVGHSHALLGAFNPLAPIVAMAFERLDAHDAAGFRDLLAPTETLSRLIFESPTQFYKVGVVWLAYLRGEQEHFALLDGLEQHRDTLHLAALVREADRLGLFADPELAAHRARTVFAGRGVA